MKTTRLDDGRWAVEPYDTERFALADEGVTRVVFASEDNARAFAADATNRIEEMRELLVDLESLALDYGDLHVQSTPHEE